MGDVHRDDAPVVTAPDGLEVRELTRTKGGSTGLFCLPVQGVGRAIKHRSVDEIWYVLKGCGQLWRRRQEETDTVTELLPGMCLAIPAETCFQVSAGAQALEVFGVTMPPWPGDGEVRLVAGRWRPVHSNPNPTGPNLTGRYELRDARQTEGHELLELAVQSKAFWGYSEAFLAACRSELTVPFGTAAHSKVLVSGGDLVGITTVSPLIGEEADLAHLFVRPANIGNGCGVILFQAARELALGFGAKSLLIEADPQALSFYRRMGAQQIGERPSGSISGRMLPLLRLLL